ncbi:MAG: zinc finger protein [Harvfovirus sp.]|uniref:Zinc finger protein n=1 Tax=Harvfovirus sp. TaxID=2487768 RepID=A0A3G5A2J8_9VIRU|nr:MAG: zinc finger protein [Harvfovirus sp.]
MKYYCKTCEYTTDLRANFDKHLNTSKHKLKKDQEEEQEAEQLRLMQDPNVPRCEFCNHIFSHTSGLSKHKKNCGSKDDNQKLAIKLETECKLYKAEIEKLRDRIEEERKLSKFEIERLREKTDDELKSYKTEIEKLRDKLENQLRSGNVNITNVLSTNALNFVTNHYNNAPEIQKFTSLELLGVDDLATAETAIYHYKHKTHAKWIGDVIVTEYRKKNNPSDQSLWNTDTSRLAYIVRETINRVLIWCVDKEGIKTSEYLIKPILDKIKAAIQFFIIDSGKKMEGDDNAKILKLMEMGGEFMNAIDDGSLNKSILRHIAPAFHLDKKIVPIKLITDKNHSGEQLERENSFPEKDSNNHEQIEIDDTENIIDDDDDDNYRHYCDEATANYYPEEGDSSA